MDDATGVSQRVWWRTILENRYIAGPIKFLLPFGIGIILFAILYLLLSYQDFLNLSGLLAAYFIPPAGKESIIPIAIMMGYPWWLVTFAIFMVDAAVSLFIVWNFDLALKIPLIGRLIESGMKAGREFFEARPWIRRFSTIGLILFVFFPFQGTGSMNGSILGRLLGLEKARVFLCVCTGSFLSSLLIALGADLLLDIYRENNALGVGLLAAILVTFIAAVVALRLRKKRLRKRKSKAGWW